MEPKDWLIVITVVALLIVLARDDVERSSKVGKYDAAIEQCEEVSGVRCRITASPFIQTY